MKKELFVGTSKMNASNGEVEGNFCDFDGARYYQISNVDQLRPFLMSLASSENHWLFLSSNKGITAGRKSSEYALFPYTTGDKLIGTSGYAGSKSIILVTDHEKTAVWEPLCQNFKGIYRMQRNLYKSKDGSHVIFEEINKDLNLAFRERWATSGNFGIVKTSSLINLANEKRSIELLDGIQNIVPAGVDEYLQQTKSNLTDAYKKAELEYNQLGIYSLSARIVDKAIPSESLEATIAWCSGVTPKNILLSNLQLDNFKFGLNISTERDVRAEKGAYFANLSFDLDGQAEKKWHIISDVGQNIVQIIELRKYLDLPDIGYAEVEQDIERNSQHLIEKVAKADGLQQSGDEHITTRHYSNVLFNILRGGIITDNYVVGKDDYLHYITSANKSLIAKHDQLLSEIPEQIDLDTLKAVVNKTNDKDLLRLTVEYLPLTFSRRHGDPSRPWNKFNIITRDAHNNELKYYEGNWRDIFQNWEALSFSFPGFLEGMIIKFLNASTIDGYNPYRISTMGVDWEVEDPEDPWAYIGYWGDHQLIYLLKLLENLEKFYPGRLENLLQEEICVFANVPYRIKTFNEILDDPHNTITFDHDLERDIERSIGSIGSDAKLVMADEGKALYTSVIEKLLIPILTKIGNFIPDAGIWMNTQRPEWNDANNALVGYGVSMVTLYQLRRYAAFLVNLLSARRASQFLLHEPVADYFEDLKSLFDDADYLRKNVTTDEQRLDWIKAAGLASENYRRQAYNYFKNTQKSVLSAGVLHDFFENLIIVLDKSIQTNQREDNLYHAYNLISFHEQGANIQRLDLMLEGQVNILASGYLDSKASLEILRALRSSALYREDQNSYLLYPNKQRPTFLERNNIDEAAIEGSALVEALATNGNKEIILFDDNGVAHFNANLHNADELAITLDKLANDPTYSALVDKERARLLSVYEAVFHHKSFTGRSGTFYGYEGLGSIYWHMVSKLLLSVSELVERASRAGDQELLHDLIAEYYEIREGIGVHKKPQEYGAIPSDPYSHTPGNKGAQQPGMTGQVKEDILSRFSELGVRIIGGSLVFEHAFFNEKEFLQKPSKFKYLAIDDEWKTLNLNKGTLAFTICQVPVIYERSSSPGIKILHTDGSEEQLSGQKLTPELTHSIFTRAGKISEIRVRLQ